MVGNARRDNPGGDVFEDRSGAPRLANSVAVQSLSKSVATTVSQPARSSPTSRPPAPEKSETTFRGEAADT